MEKRIFSPKESYEAIVSAGVAKAALPLRRMLVLAVFAGAFIALAGVASTIVSVGGNPRLAAGCIFPAGLALVVFTGAELFTGNNLMLMARLEGKISTAAMLRNWAVVWLGNFAGAAFVAFAVFYGGVFATEEALQGLAATAAAKCMPFHQGLLKGILCNILVSLGVYMAASGRDAAGKVAALFFPVAIFVVGGYEHCVANMYYFTVGLLAQAALPEAAAVTVADIFVHNLIAVTLGNILGGGCFLGGGLWYIYGKEQVG